MEEPKKFKLSATDKKLGGVCGGLAEYLSVDVTILRLLYVAFTIMTGFVLGIFLYFLCVFVAPKG